MPKQTAQINQSEELIKTIEDLTFTIEMAKNQNSDYSPYMQNVIAVLKEIGNGYNDNGCLHKIHHELRLLNKTLIMAALLISATKNPEQTLNKYNKIIEQYLN